MRGSRGGQRSEAPPPPKNDKNIGFSSNTGPIPWKISKLPSQHSIKGHHRLATETPAYSGTWILPPLIIKKNVVIFGPSQTKLSGSPHDDPQRLRPLIVWLGSSLPLWTKKKMLSKLVTLWQNFLDPPIATHKGSNQPAHTRSLIRAFANRLRILWLLSYWSKSFGVSKLKRRLHRLAWVYTCQNATLLETTCRGSA